MTTQVIAIPRARAEARREATTSWAVRVLAFAWRHWGALAAMALAVGIHIPTLGYYFGGDDLVVMGDIAAKPFGPWFADLFFLRDVTPNWRPLTHLVYWSEYQVFGLNPLAFRLVNLGVHTASVGLLYAFVGRLSGRRGAGAFVAAGFAAFGAHFDTVSYITALPHLLATFLVLVSMFLMLVYAQGGSTRHELYAGSVLAFIAVLLVNEGSVIFAPAVALVYVLFAPRPLSIPRAVAAALPFAIILWGFFAFYQTCECENIKVSTRDMDWGPHQFRNMWLYLSWLVLPTGTLDYQAHVMHWIMGSVVLAIAAAALVRGPNWVRLAAVTMILALLPFTPVKVWTAPRYTYASTPFFLMFAVALLLPLWERARAFWKPGAVLSALLLSASLVGFYAHQTYVHNRIIGEMTQPWEFAVAELRSMYPEVPPGTTIYILDGPWSDPLWQLFWMPSVGRVLYGDGRVLAMDGPDFVERHPELLPNEIVLMYRDGELRRPYPGELPIRPALYPEVIP